MHEQGIAIFGATSAIAEATARIWASKKNHLILIGRNLKHLEEIKADLLARGATKVDCESLDFLDFDQHETFCYRLFRNSPAVNTVLLAHGDLGDQKMEQQSFTQARKSLEINMLSTVSLLTVIANIFEVKKTGTIAIIGSVAGDRGRQSNYIYGTAKGAIAIFTQGLRNRLQKSGVQVVTIKPGFVDTPMTSHLPKGMLFVKPDVIAKGIMAAIANRKDIVYLPTFWRLIMWVIRMIPEKLFKRLNL